MVDGVISAHGASAERDVRLAMMLRETISNAGTKQCFASGASSR
jgi:hypothetical protein